MTTTFKFAAALPVVLFAVISPAGAKTVVRDHGTSSKPVIRDHRTTAPVVRDHRSSAHNVQTGPNSFKRVTNSWSNWKPSH